MSHRRWGSLTTGKYLSLVVEPTKQGFRSIVAVFETVLQCSRGSRHAPWLMFLLWRWLDRALPDTFGGQNSTFERIATPEWLGDELGRWADPALAVKVIDILTQHCNDDWRPRLAGPVAQASQRQTPAGAAVRPRHARWNQPSQPPSHRSMSPTAKPAQRQ